MKGKAVMMSWQQVAVRDADGKVPEGLARMYRRAMAGRKINKADRDGYEIVEARYRTDGYTTLAFVALRDRVLPSAPPVYGYGVSVRAVADEHREEAGANAALRDALDNAARVVLHHYVDVASWVHAIEGECRRSGCFTKVSAWR